MSNLTLISHFFNEQYLLPLFISQHRDLFDHAIMIDYGSTDDSVDIIRTLAPHWKVVSSRNAEFDARRADREVAEFEQKLKGWKVALNVTEFLDEDPREYLSSTKAQGVRFPGVTMIDREPSSPLSWEVDLPSQKPWGIDELLWRWLMSQEEPRSVLSRPGYGVFAPQYRGRLIHRAESAGYTTGRHGWSLPDVVDATSGPRILWFGFAPWTPEFLARKLQISPRMSSRDRRTSVGIQHTYDRGFLEQARTDLAVYARAPYRMDAEWPVECREVLFAIERSMVERVDFLQDFYENRKLWRYTAFLRNSWAYVHRVKSRLSSPARTE